ncbi:PA14 domain-containing protein [Bacillus thuringiensis]|nr:PA14 domain-containing protein [Bacillus thuringiensis]
MSLIGYYFNDKNFRELAFITLMDSGETKLMKKDIQHLLVEEKQTVQSVRWLGYIQSSKTDRYLFSTSDDSQVIVQIDEEIIINQSSMVHPLHLDKDKTYQIRIEYRPEQSNPSDIVTDFQLYWSCIDIDEKMVIQSKNLLLPNCSRRNKNKIASPLLPQTSLFDSELIYDDILDTDDDGIPDDWEINGYTVDKNLVVKWDDSIEGKGYAKYVSDPSDANSVGDSYTDLERVLNSFTPNS